MTARDDVSCFAGSPFLSFAGNNVCKHYPDSDVAVEYAKAQAIAGIVSREAQCDTPRPLRLCEEDGRIEFSFLPSQHSLAYEYAHFLRDPSTDSQFLTLVDRAAHLLASIHCQLDLPTRSQFDAPVAFDAAARFGRFAFPHRQFEKSPRAFLHCDFGFANLACAKDRRSEATTLIIYDPSPNDHSTFAPDQYGSIYLDIGCFFASLNGRFPLRHQIAAKWTRVEDAKRRFADAYAASSGHNVDLELAESVGYATAFASFTKWRGNGWRRRIGMTLLYNRFKQNTNWMNLPGKYHDAA